MSHTDPRALSAPLNPESLLAYEPFVRAVARGLLSNEEEVGEVVQETWLRAFRRPPQHGSSPKGWLAMVVRNLVRDRFRGDSRRRAREEAVARPDRTAADSQSQLEGHKTLVDAVLELEEPYKSVVILRYYEELKPAEIAKRLDREPATVRSQLHRAHELLRSQMDAEYGGERAAWAGLCLPLVPSAIPAGAEGQLAAKGASSFAVPLALKLVGIGLALMISALVLSPLLREVLPESSVLLGLADASGSHQTIPIALAPRPGGGANPATEPVANVSSLGARKAESAAGVEGVNDLPTTVGKTPALQVIVRDTQGGTLAGVPVALLNGLVDFPGDAVRSANFVHVQVLNSDSEGAVTFHGVVAEGDWAWPGERYYEVRLSVPGVDVAARFDPEDERTQLITLQLPPTGSVRVRTVDQKGEPLLLSAEVSLASRRQRSANSQTVALLQGQALFPFVGLSEPLEVRVVSQVLGFAWDAEGKGPSKAGETVTIDVVSPNRPILVGRALDASGAALAKKQIQVQFRSDKRDDLGWVVVQTDPLGRYTVEVGERIKVGSKVLVSLHKRSWGSWGDWQARVDFPAPLLITAGTVQVGEHRLEPRDPRARGRCVDPQGNPVADLELSLATYFDRRSHGVTTDSEGKFSTSSGFWPDVIELSINRDPELVLVQPTNLIAGAQELEVPVIKGGKIAGQVLPATQIPLSEVVYIVHKSGTTQTGTGWADLGLPDENSGAFTTIGLARGSYDFLIRHQARLVFEARGIQVEDGRTTHPFDLQAIDLSTPMGTLEFLVSTADGKPLRCSTAVYIDKSRVLGTETRAPAKRVKLDYPIEGDPRVVVMQTGYRPVAFEPDDAPAEVTLKPGISVFLNTKDLGEIQSGDRSVSMSYFRDADKNLPWTHALSAFVPGALAVQGRASVTFPGPGTYRLHLSVAILASSGMSMVGLPSPRPFTVDVDEFDQDGELQVSLPKDLFKDE